MSRHGKRRRPKGDAPPGGGSYPPRLSDEQGYWEEGSRTEAGRPAPEQEAPYPPAEADWPRQDEPWERRDSYRNDFYRADPYGDEAYRADPYRDEPYGDEPYRSERYRGGRHPDDAPREDPYRSDAYRWDPYPTGPTQADPRYQDRSDPYSSTGYFDTNQYEPAAPYEPPYEPEGYRIAASGRIEDEEFGRVDDAGFGLRPDLGEDLEPALDTSSKPEPEPADVPSRRARRDQGKPRKQPKQARGRVRRPDPPPLETNDVAVVALGTVAWGLAFGGLYMIRDRLEEQGYGWALWSCLAGFGLGLLGLWYVRRRRYAIARDAIGRDAGPAAGQAAAARAAEREPDAWAVPETEPESEPESEPGPELETEPETSGARWPADPHPMPEHYDLPGEYDDAPVTGEIVFDDGPLPRYSPADARSYRPVDPPSFRHREPLFDPDDDYDSGWDAEDPPYRPRR